MFILNDVVNFGRGRGRDKQVRKIRKSAIKGALIGAGISPVAAVGLGLLARKYNRNFRFKSRNFIETSALLSGTMAGIGGYYGALHTALRTDKNGNKVR